jgi:hypothetical protein
MYLANDRFLPAASVGKSRALSGRVSEPTRFSSASEGGRQGIGSRDCASSSLKIVRTFTNALEWRCLDRIRAPIQELCVTNFPD